jgi:hypothetical protein
MENTIQTQTTSTAWDLRHDVWILVRRHGLAYLTMLFLAWYFYSENSKLKAEVVSNKTEVVTYYKNDNAEMRRVLEENNRLIKRNNEIFETFLKQKR